MSLESDFLTKMIELSGTEYESAIEAEKALKDSVQGRTWIMEALQYAVSLNAPNVKRSSVLPGNRGIRVTIRPNI